MTCTLIVITGYSCTGKTTLAKMIGKRFDLPVIGRDDFKESLFDSLGYSDREWSKKLGIASYRLLYLMTENLLSSNISLIVESNFKTQNDTKKLKYLKNKYQCYLLQIHCYVEIPLALSRFRERAESGNRHPGHVDHLIYEEIEYSLKKGGYEILDICNRTIRIDTTNFDIDYTTIFQTVRECID